MATSHAPQPTSESLLDALPPQEALLLRVRFGIPLKAQPTPAAVAHLLGLSEAESSALESRALRRLRTPSLFARVRRELAKVSRPSVSLRAAIESAKALEPALIRYLKERPEAMASLPWEVFEHLVGEFLAQQGYLDVRLVGRDASTAADIYCLGTLPGGLTAPLFVEVKREKALCGLNVIQNVVGARVLEEPVHGWTAAMVVAVAGFTKSRRYSKTDLALRQVHLRDRHDLERWLLNYSARPTGLWLPCPQTHMPHRAPNPGMQRTRYARR